MISTVSFSIVEENQGFIKLTYVKSQTCNLRFFLLLILTVARSMDYFDYFETILYNVTSGNAINLLGMAIASDSLLVTKQVLRCQKD